MPCSSRGASSAVGRRPRSMADSDEAAAREPHPSTVEPVRRRRRRKIVDAHALADAVCAVGFERLTIEAVAAHLDTAHSALYHHVRDRDALVVLAADRLFGVVRWPPAADGWRAYLDGCGRVASEVLEAHPGLALELTRLAMPSAVYRDQIAAMCAALESFGFGRDQAFLAVDLVMDLAVDAAVRTRYQDLAYPRTRDGGPNPWFTEKLAVALDGIGARLAPS